MAAETIVAPYNDLVALRSIVAAQRGKIAAIIVEPVAANMGVIAPAPGFLEGLRALTAREGALLVFDEVITGFRVARGGAQARYGVRPDLTVLGKVIGGGLPIGAYGGQASLMDLVAPSGPVYQAGTLAGHPIAMAAGMATLDALDDELYAELERLGAGLAAGLATAAADAGVPVAISRVGSLLTVFFRSGLPHDHATARESDTEAFGRFHRASRAAGLHAAPSQFEAWFLSAAHTDSELAAIVEAARAGFVAAGTGAAVAERGGADR